MMMVILATAKTPLRPNLSLIGAALKEPTSSPTLIIAVMYERADAGKMYVPSGWRSPKSRTKTSTKYS